MSSVHKRAEEIKKGGAKKYHENNTRQGKKFARERIALLCDEGSFVEDGLYAHCMREGFPADGVITGLGKVEGRSVAVVANDSTVKAGSWGRRTVEKILRLQETAWRLQIPCFYLVDSAGARITDQVQMFPGRRGAGHIFYNESMASGYFPQICILFGPSAAGGAYIPAFCDLLVMVNGNASMYLGSPRMAEMVIGEKVSLEEMGGAEMHCKVSGSGDYLAENEEGAITFAKKYFAYMPQNCEEKTHRDSSPNLPPDVDLKALVPENEGRAYDMKKFINGIVDKESFLEIKALYAKEVITGLARMDGRAIGIVANQPSVKAGVLFVESSNKAARFIQICDAFNIPLLFLCDVPGFMIGSKIEKEGMIRSGAKLVYSVSRARVPKISVIVRKAYGAGLYAMSGPAFDSDAVIALPTSRIAVMGPGPAVNAVYYNQMADLSPEEKKKFIEEKTKAYEEEIDLFNLAGELVVDHVIEFSDLREEVVKRFMYYDSKKLPRPRAGIMPM